MGSQISFRVPFLPPMKFLIFKVESANLSSLPECLQIWRDTSMEGEFYPLLKIKNKVNVRDKKRVEVFVLLVGG